MNRDEYTNQEHFLDVGDGYQLYVHDWGSKKAARPIFFLHGGPGGHTKDKHKNLFNPEKQRVIFFDQRGSGKSLPAGSIENNTTQKMVEDISKIADYFDIDTFVITGGSWGSCLALAYALEHPKRVAAMILNGIFTGSNHEIEWLDHGKFKTFYPDIWEKFLYSVPAKRRANPSAYFYEQIMSDNSLEAKEAGYAYENMEGGVISLDDRFTPDNFEEYDPSGIRIEMHYMHNRCFLPDRYILDNAHKIHAPTWLIQGRYDMVCPPETAYELSKLMPKAQLIWTTSGHYTERESWNLIRTLLQVTTEP
jgi:proline iminopeptidase